MVSRYGLASSRGSTGQKRDMLANIGGMGGADDGMMECITYLALHNTNHNIT